MTLISHICEIVVKLGASVRFRALGIMRSIYKRRPEPFLIHLLQVPLDLLSILIGFEPRKKFVIFGQGRTGSTLLETLLASHPRIDRAWELLDKRRRKWNLSLYINARSRLSRNDVWGFKAKYFQLSDEQKVDPGKFLSRLHERGWKIIYIKRRNLLRQAVSHFIRLHRGRPHKEDNASEDISVRIKYVDLIRRIEQQEIYLVREEEVLRNLPHITLVYEDDLLNQADHQRTLDKLFKFLDVPSAPVSTYMIKVTPEDLSQIVENFDELAHSLRGTRYEMNLEEA